MKEFKRMVVNAIYEQTDVIIASPFGNLIVENVGSKWVHVINERTGNKEKYSLHDCAKFIFGDTYRKDIFLGVLRDSHTHYWCTKYEDNKDVIIKRSLHIAREEYGIGSIPQDSIDTESAINMFFKG